MILISVVSSSIYCLFTKKFHLKKDNDPISYVISLLFTVSIMSFLLYTLFYFNKDDLATVLRTEILVLVILEFIFVAINAVIFQTLLKKAPLSEITVLMSSSGFITLLLSRILGISGLEINGIIGGVLVLIGVAIVSLGNEKWKFKGVFFYILFATVSSAIAMILDNKIIFEYEISPLFWVVLSYLFPAIIISIVFCRSVAKIPRMLSDGSNRHLLFIAVISSFISYYFIYSSYNFGVNASQANFILSTQNVLIVVLSILFLNEKKNILKVVSASILSSVGIWLLA